MSALITRASISSVTPGIVAIRAPASLAALRAAVWESDWTVGASTTSAASIAAATVRRRLGRVRVALGHHRQRRVGALALGDDPHQRPEALGGRVADHQHLLAGSTARQSLTTASTALSRSSATTARLLPRPRDPDITRRYHSRPRRSSSAG